ncbi:hypothetical protein ILUMI_10426 [Ignelater luminosus]|uniref:Peptidase S1 domain-containing protein n=1 Tax=Ignelater luminosus TaxID=2038154 RepID=A0A8K0GBH6_IGNLU|nr:hypothetical protein ILUMI_10426 [Ignelater luminosus]
MILTSVFILIACLFAVYDLKTNPKKKKSSSNRLVEGISTTISEFPFMVALTENNRLFCSGSIIEYHWVLTAARCIVDTNKSYQGILTPNKYFANNVVVVRGNTTYYDGSEREKSDHTVSSYIFHNSYSRTLKAGPHNDIGLIKVKQPFNGVYEKRIPLATTPEMEISSQIYTRIWLFPRLGRNLLWLRCKV